MKTFHLVSYLYEDSIGENVLLIAKAISNNCNKVEHLILKSTFKGDSIKMIKSMRRFPELRTLCFPVAGYNQKIIDSLGEMLMHTPFLQTLELMCPEETHFEGHDLILKSVEATQKTALT